MKTMIAAAVVVIAVATVALSDPIFDLDFDLLHHELIARARRNRKVKDTCTHNLQPREKKGQLLQNVFTKLKSLLIVFLLIRTDNR